MAKRHSRPPEIALPDATNPHINPALMECIENEWLGLGDTSLIRTGNVFEPRSVEDVENPVLQVLSLMRSPEYFYFTCKHFLNREILPIQACILSEFWHRPFPALFATRGFGKCIVGDSLIVTNKGFARIDSLAKDAPVQQPVYDPSLRVCGENGFKDVAYSWNNGFGPTVKIKTRHGYEIEGTPNHPLRVASEQGVVWKNMGEIQRGDFIVIDRNPDGHWHDANDIRPETAYLFGLLVGDGCYTQRNVVTLTTSDEEIAEAASKESEKLWGKRFKKVPSAKYDYRIHSIPVRAELFDKYGFEQSECGKKCIPACVMGASKEAVAAFIRGLMDTDGTVQTGNVSYTSKSERLVKEVQFLMTRLGIASKAYPKLNKKYQSYHWNLEISGRSLREYLRIIGFGLSRKQEKLEKLCKAKVNDNIDLIPKCLTRKWFYELREEYRTRNQRGKRGSKQGDVLSRTLSPDRYERYDLSYGRLKEILDKTESCKETKAWTELDRIHRTNNLYSEVVFAENGMAQTYDVHIPNDHSFVSNGFVSHNTFLLGVYVMLRLLLNPGVKVVVVGAAFRQSKFVFDVCLNIWNSSPILKDIAGPGSGPRFENDRCSMRIGDSVGIYLPTGTGEKIRGERAGILIADEIAAQKVDIFENVVSGFASVSMDPIAKVKEAARQRAKKRLGIFVKDDSLPSVPGLNSNQTILAGTCYYKFNHSYDYFQKYKRIIESKGDVNVLKEIFNGEIPPKFDWRDYAVVRIPYDLLPEGYMDVKHIGKAKSTLHKSQFVMEYSACVGPDTPVITDKGPVRIVDVEPGDLVLTHKGRFRPVTEVTKRPFKGKVIEWNTFGGYSGTVTTPEHPFWDGKEWKPIKEVDDFTTLSHLSELNGKTSVDVGERASDWMETPAGKIYPRHSQSKFTREEIIQIRNNPMRDCDIARQYGVRQGVIHCIRKKPRAPKNAIPKTIKLDYDFGLIVGYYASEGSTGAGGRSVGFALDGHVGCGLEEYVKELAGACHRVFGFRPKVYRKDSVANVTVNQRLVVELLKSICPGVSHTKVIDPEVLFSNREFMKGFVVGYWNGDGHRSNDNGVAVAGCVNLNLLTQVRLCLSYFGVTSCLRPNRHAKGTATFRGKTYKTKKCYLLTMQGQNLRKFNSVFYGEEYQELPNLQKYWSEEKHSRFKFNRKQEVDYDGLVYNLEVEEDHSYSLLNATVHNCFSGDSDGFFKMSLIEQCVVGSKNPDIRFPSTNNETVYFSAALRGDMGRNYVIAVDPASESDNFAVAVLEIWPDHRRVVYCWTTTRKRHKARLAKNVVKEHDFYQYCARKIRDLCVLFPCARLCVDKLGGGISVMEALGDPERLLEGEVPILPIIEEGVDKDTDRMPGDHILELVYFAKSDWVSLANNGLKFDLESKVLLFPAFDEAAVGLAMEEDRMMGRIVTNEDGSEEVLYDTLEDCVMNIEEMKEELASIVHTQTGLQGRDHWDTPKTRDMLGNETRTRKDRYSALLMANMAARTMVVVQARPQYYSTGGFATDLRGAPPQPKGHFNPPGYTSRLSEGNYGAVVSKRRR